METAEDVNVLDQEEEINIYDDVCDFDFGEEIEKLKAQNKKLEEHVCTLNGDIDKLNGTIVELKETQNNLTMNISALFVTAKGEIERKNRMIEELRVQVDNRHLSRFNPEFRKRRDREDSPSEASKPKKFKYDSDIAKGEELVQERNKLDPKSEEREPRSKSSDRYRQVDDNNKSHHRSKYPADSYSEKFENNKRDDRFQHSESDTNKRYKDRYNNYEDDGYHSRSTYYNRRRNDSEDRYEPKSQHFNDRYNHRANNYSERDEMYSNREYQSHSRSSRSNLRDTTLRERNEYRGEQGKYSQYTDSRFSDRFDSNYSRTERTRSVERPGQSRSGTSFAPFTPFASDNTSRKTEHDASSDASNSERRSITPMPLAEDIEETKPKPPKRRLKMLEEMEKKVKQNRLSQSRSSDQNDGVSNKPPDINKSCDSDRNSVKSNKSDRESQRDEKRKQSNTIKEKDTVKNKTECRNETKNINACKKDIGQSKEADKEKIGKIVRQNETESTLKLIPNKSASDETKEQRQKSSKTAKAEMTQNSSFLDGMKLIEKEVKCDVRNEPKKDAQKEVKLSTKVSSDKSQHQNQSENKNSGKPNRGVKKSPVKHPPGKEDRKSQERTNKMKDQNIANKIKDNTEIHTKHVDRNQKVVLNEEMKSTVQPNEDWKEKIGKENVDNGLRRNPVDNKENTDKDTKTIKQSQPKTVEEITTCSKNGSTQPSAEIGAISKESEQKNETHEQTAKGNNRGEKHKNIVKNKDKKQNQEEKLEQSIKIIKERQSKSVEEIGKDSSKLDKSSDKSNKKSVINDNQQSKEDVRNKNIKNDTKESKPDNAKQETTKEEKTRAKHSRSKEDGKDDKKDVQLESQNSEANIKETKVYVTKNTIVKSLDKNENKKVQSKSEDGKRQNKENVVNKNMAKDTKDSTADTVKQKVTKEDKKKSSSSNNDKKKDSQLTEVQIDEGGSIKESKDKVKERFARKNLSKHENKEGQSKPVTNIEPVEDLKRKRKSTVLEGDEYIKNETKNPEAHSTEACGEGRKNQNDGESSLGSKVNQVSKRKRISSGQEKVVEQSTTKSLQEVPQKQPGKMSDSEKIAKSSETNLATDDLLKIKQIANQKEQRNRIDEAKRKLTFSKEELVDILGQSLDKQKLKNQNISSKENSSIATKMKEVAPTNDSTKIASVSSTESLEKKQETDKEGTSKAGEEGSDSTEKIEEEVPQIKNKTPTKFPPKEPPTKVAEKQNESSSSSSTDSESDSENDSEEDLSDNMLTSVKPDNKLIEIKDIEHEKPRQIESTVSLSDSSTSDDTIVLNNTNNTKTTENKCESVINNYIESLTKENVKENEEKTTKLDDSAAVNNEKIVVTNDDNSSLKQDVVVEMLESKITVLEVIKVSAEGKMEIHSSSNKNLAPSSSKEFNGEKSTLTPKLGIQQTSSSPVRPTNRRITPTPVRDSKPLCSFENILTKTCPPKTFVTATKTEASPLHLTDDGEIPVLHLEEHHINNLPTEVNINDKNIMTLLDTMNISNIECEIPKFKNFSGDAAGNSEVNGVGGSDCGLTFKNKIERTVCTAVKSQETVVLTSGVLKIETTADAGSVKSASSSKEVTVTPTTVRRGRRRCWMIIKDN